MDVGGEGLGLGAWTGVWALFFVALALGLDLYVCPRAAFMRRMSFHVIF